MMLSCLLRASFVLFSRFLSRVPRAFFVRLTFCFFFFMLPLCFFHACLLRGDLALILCGRSSIGAWYGVLEFVGMASVLTNW